MSAESRSSPAAKRRLLDVLLLLGIWVLAVVVLDPRGDFPLNDDWAYAIAVRRLVEEGVFRPPGWAGMTLLSQALWGAAAVSIGGFSYTVLRLSTLVLGGAAVIGTYLLARELRATRALALIAALTLAANPLFVVLAFTFMTDVPMLAMMVCALLAFARTLNTGSRLAWAAGTALTIAGTLCKQPAIVPALGFVVAVFLCSSARRAWWWRSLLAVGLASASLYLFQTIMQAYDALPHDYWLRTEFIRRLWQIGPRGAYSIISGNAGVVITYIGLFLLPLLIAVAPGWRRMRPSWWRWGGTIETLALVIGGVALWSSGRRVPMRGNVLIQSGLGPITLNDWYIRGLTNDPRLPAWVWWTVTVVAIAAAAALAARLVAAAAQCWRERGDVDAPGAARVLLLATAVLYFGATSMIPLFDRYVLPFLPIVAAALIPPNGGRGRGRGAAAGAGLVLLLFGAYAVAGTHDYLAWNRTRWEALGQLAAEGVAPERIDGGLEFNAPLFYVEGSSGAGAGGRSWWWVADDEYVIAMGPVPGYDIARELPYRRWLLPGEGRIAVLHRTPRR